MPSESTTQFERSFADLAYAYLNEKAPKLDDFLVGFQVIDKSDDDTRAAGVFGFKVGRNWMYGPVLFLNGELKGHELLYLKEQDAIVPLQENWVNYLINRRPVEAGESASREGGGQRFDRPDFSIFRRSPLSKAGSYARGDVFDTKPFAQLLAEDPQTSTFYKHAADRTDLVSFMKVGGRMAARAISKAVLDDPAFASAVMRFYDPRELIKASEGTLEKKKGDVRRTAPTEDGIQVIEVADGMLPVDLTEDESERLVRDQIVIRDHRTGTSQTYVLDTPDAFSNPSQDCGLCDLIIRPNETMETFVCTAPIPIGTGSYDKVLAVRTDEKRWGSFCSSDLWVRRRAETSEWKALYDSLPSADSLSVGQTYLIVSPDGQASLPFTVMQKERMGDTDRFLVHEECYADHTHKARRLSSKDGGMSYKRSEVRPIVVGTKAERMLNVGDTLMVPGGFKAMKLESDSSYDFGACPGTLADLQAHIFKQGAVELQVYASGQTYQVQAGNRDATPPLTKVAATLHLMREQGVHKDAAERMLKEAAQRGRGAWAVMPAEKKASPYLLDRQPTAPDVNALDEIGYDDHTGYPTVFSDRQYLPAETDTDQNEELYDPDPRLDSTPIQAAVAASATGNKEVFDIPVLAGLIKAVNVEDLTDRYIGDLMTGLDRVGRLLLLFYWHNDKFRDRYGDGEMQELEDSIRNTFKSTGDLILFLKKKAVEPDLAAIGSDVDLSEIS